MDKKDTRKNIKLTDRQFSALQAMTKAVKENHYGETIIKGLEIINDKNKYTTEIIEKLIADIPDWMVMDDNGGRIELKQQLRDKWL